MAKLSSLIVDLQANTTALKTGLDQANGLLEGFGKKAASAGKLVAHMFAFHAIKEAAHEIMEFVEKGAEAADTMGKMAMSAGMSVESFSHLAYAAGFAELSTEDLGKSINKLNKNVAAAATGSKEQALLFKTLGVAVTNTDGSIRSADQVMGDLAEKFSHMQNGTAKSALAMEIFGKAGAKMIPLLNRGREGLAKMAEEADHLGQTITEHGFESSEMFMEALKRLNMIGDGLSKQIAQELAPSLATFSEELMASVTSSDLLSTAAKGIAAVLRTVVTAGAAVVGVFRFIGTGIGALAGLAATLAEGNFKGAKEAFVQYSHDSVQTLIDMKHQISAIWTHDPPHGPLEGEKKKTDEDADKILKSIAKRAKAIEEMKKSLESLRKLATDQQFQALTFGFDEADLLQARMLFGDLALEMKKAGKAGQKMGEQMLEAARALRLMKQEKNTKEVGKNADVSKSNSENHFAANWPRMETQVNKGSTAGLRQQAGILDAALAFAAEVKAAFSAAGAALMRGAQTLLGAMGGIGGILNGLLDSLKEGDIFGAVVGAISGIMIAAPAFAAVIDIAAGILGAVAKSLNGLVDGLAVLLGAVGMLLEAVIGALAPIFKEAGKMLTELAAIIVVLAQLLGPYLTYLTPILTGISIALQAYSIAVEGLYYALKYVSLGLLWVAKGIVIVFDGVIDAINAVLRLLANIEILGGKPLGFLNDWANTLQSVRVSTTQLDTAIGELAAQSFDGAIAKAQEAGAGYKAAAAADKAADAMDNAAAAASGLTNVPALVKVNRLRGMAMDLAPVFKLYIDGREVYVMMEKQAALKRFNESGSR